MPLQNKANHSPRDNTDISLTRERGCCKLHRAGVLKSTHLILFDCLRGAPQRSISLSVSAPIYPRPVPPSYLMHPLLPNDVLIGSILRLVSTFKDNVSTGALIDSSMVRRACGKGKQQHGGRDEMFFELLKIAITYVAAKKQTDLRLNIIKLGQLFTALDSTV